MKTKIIALSALLISSFSFNADAATRSEMRDFTKEIVKYDICKFRYADESNKDDFQKVSDKFANAFFSDLDIDLDYIIKMQTLYSDKLENQYVVKRKISTATIVDSEKTRLNLLDMCESLLD